MQDYVPIISGLASIFVIIWLYDSIQSRLKSKSSRMNRQLAFATNFGAVVGLFLLIGIAFYLLASALISAAGGTNKFLDWQF
jgi:hypothetical protein